MIYQSFPWQDVLLLKLSLTLTVVIVCLTSVTQGWFLQHTFFVARMECQKPAVKTLCVTQFAILVQRIKFTKLQLSVQIHQDMLEEKNLIRPLQHPPSRWEITVLDFLPLLRSCKQCTVYYRYELARSLLLYQSFGSISNHAISADTCLV